MRGWGGFHIKQQEWIFIKDLLSFLISDYRKLKHGLNGLDG
jgi:hypothetical protein